MHSGVDLTQFSDDEVYQLAMIAAADAMRLARQMTELSAYTTRLQAELDRRSELHALASAQVAQALEGYRRERG